MNINGILNFRVASSIYGPSSFPLGLHSLIAVFYHDVDVRHGGLVSYQLANDYRTTNLAVSYLNELYGATDINSPRSQNFTPEMVLTVTWNEVHPFIGSPQDSKNCTFQAALISDGNITYTMLIYKDMQWGFEAAIGFQKNITLQFNIEHSRTSNTRNVDHFSNVGRRGVFVYRVDGKLTLMLHGIVDQSCMQCIIMQLACLMLLVYYYVVY